LEAAGIREVVAAGLAAFCSEDRCSVGGPEVSLPSQTAVSLALALHELATKASKDGALSQPGGKVHVSWSVDDKLDFCWREVGGAPVVPPASRGFGTRMIERSLAAEFGGSVELQFGADGVTCRVVAPVPRVPD
jgi:two-component sensor histidine kinase